MPFKALDIKKSWDKMGDAPAKRGPRLLRPRASRACQYCRSRKVRCDWAATGNPCTNCRLDERTCIALPRKRTIARPENRGTKRKSRIEQSESGTKSIELTTPSPSESNMDKFSLRGSLFPEGMEANVDDRMSDRDYSQDEYSISADSINGDTFSQGLASQITRPLVAVNRSAQSPPTTYGHPNLPPFIHPLAPSVISEDGSFLERKGALDVPERILRNALLRKYVDYVHPCLPVLDLEDFLQSVQSDGASGSVSLLLFQSVMFAAVPFIDTSVLRAAGLDRKVLQKTYFERARLLYEFDAESDRVVLVQALLLLTYWYESPSNINIKDSWHWMSISISMARSVGLHLNPQPLNFDRRTVGLRKRIWWSCYMRDRLVALSMQRPLLIQDDDCNVPMLELQDFETTTLSPAVLRLLGAGSSAADSARRTQLAVMCVEKAKLCRCISHVLSAQYSVQSRRTGGDRTEATVTLVPKKSASEVGEIMKCGEELQNWFRQLPEDARYKTQNRKARKSRGVAKLHLATLSMIYYASSSALYRPHVLPSLLFEDFPELSALSRRKVHEAACEITRTAQDLMELELACYLPSNSVTALLPAAFNHLFEFRSVDASRRGRSSAQLLSCIQVLQKLGERHAVAEHAAIFLLFVIRKANIPLSILQPETSRQTHDAGIQLGYNTESVFTSPFPHHTTCTQPTSPSPPSCAASDYQDYPSLTFSASSTSSILEEDYASSLEDSPFVLEIETQDKSSEGMGEINFDSWIDLDEDFGQDPLKCTSVKSPVDTSYSLDCVY